MATPSKKDAVMILAGGATMEFLTNDSTSKQIPSEVLNYVITEIKSASKEANVQLDINNQKEKVLESVKNLTAAELIEKLKSDTTLSKLILDR